MRHFVVFSHTTEHHPAPELLPSDMPLTQTSFSCDAAQLAGVTELVGNDSLAQHVCHQFDVANKGAQAAVLQYLAQSSSTSVIETNHSINTAFILFSGYLVFIMQCGFAMVSSSTPGLPVPRSSVSQSLACLVSRSRQQPLQGLAQRCQCGSA